jgi:cytochrome c-type protein NapB
MNAAQEDDKPTGRLAAMLLFGVIAIAAIGYVVGINDGVPRQATTETRSPMLDVHAPASIDGAQRDAGTEIGTSAPVLATSYSEMRRAETGPTSRWKPTINQIPQLQFDLFEEFKPSEEDKLQSLAVRASRRAFNGAPPIIPHEIERTDDAACYACHGKGMRIENRVANQMSHGFLANCTQCHSPPAPKPFANVDAAVETTFVGLPAPKQGSRAYPGAPPTIPHSTWMRDNCLACHGREAGWAGLESTHPWRVNCEQCHAPSATLNQAITPSAFSFLPAIPIESPATSP